MMRIDSLEQSDAVLVEAAQHGRLDSFGALYQRYHNPIVALAYAQLGDKHAAEDAAQEVFAVACRDLRSLREPGKFGAWLGGICRNVTRQMLRVKSRTGPLPGEPADRPAPLNHLHCNHDRKPPHLGPRWLPDREARYGLLETPDDLLFREACLPHEPFPTIAAAWDSQPTNWTRFRGEG